MQIKRFEAKNMTTALGLIKDELGPDAVILSARSLRKGKGFFGSMKYAGVEVSAAVDNQLSPAKNASSIGRKDTYPNWGRSRIERYRPNRRKKKRSADRLPGTWSTLSAEVQLRGKGPIRRQPQSAVILIPADISPGSRSEYSLRVDRRVQTNSSLTATPGRRGS